jgi:hypothetical protein
MDERQQQNEELAWGVLVCLIFYFYLLAYTGFHVYLKYFLHYISVSGVQAYNNNTALWNALAVFGFVRAGMLVPWAETIEMILRLHVRLIVVFPLLVFTCSLNYLYNIGHCYFTMFSANGFIVNPRWSADLTPLQRREEEGNEHE